MPPHALDRRLRRLEATAPRPARPPDVERFLENCSLEQLLALEKHARSLPADTVIALPLARAIADTVDAA